MFNPATMTNSAFTARYDDTGETASPGTAPGAASQSTLGAMLAGIVPQGPGTAAPAAPTSRAGDPAGTTTATPGAPATPAAPNPAPADPAPDQTAANNADAVGYQTPPTPDAPSADQTAVADALQSMVDQSATAQNFELSPEPFVNALRDVNFVGEAQADAVTQMFGEENAGAATEFFNGLMRSAMQDMVTFQLALTQRHGEHIIGQQTQMTTQQTLRTHISDALGDNANPALINSALTMAQTLRPAMGNDFSLQQLANGAVAMLRGVAPPAGNTPASNGSFNGAGDSANTMENILSSFGAT